MNKVEEFLSRNDSKLKSEVVFDLERKFKLSKSEANKIYNDWRNRYMKGETSLFNDPKQELNLETEAKIYAKNNKKGFTEEEIKKYVNSINEIGFSGTCKKFNVEKNYIHNLYCRFLEKGLIKKKYERGAKYA